MVEIPEAGRQAAHVLLDAVSAWSAEADMATNDQAISLAIERLNEVEAVRATLGDEDVLDINISDLVGGAMVTMKYLIHQLSLTATVDEEDIIIKTREFLDDED